MYILRLRDPENNGVHRIEVEDDKVMSIMQIAAEKKIWHDTKNNEFYNLAYFIDCKKKNPHVHMIKRLPEVEEIDPVQREKNLRKFRAMRDKLFGKKIVKKI